MKSVKKKFRNSKGNSDEEIKDSTVLLWLSSIISFQKNKGWDCKDDQKILKYDDPKVKLSPLLYE